MSEMTDEKLAEILGQTAMREYEQAPDWDKTKIREWAAELVLMSDEDFEDECASKIYDSALMQRFKGNHEGTHCRASACYEESVRRFKFSHDEECRGDSLYKKGFNRAYRTGGHTPDEPRACTCGAEN